VRVCSVRNHHDIAVYRETDRQSHGELTVSEAAALLGLTPTSVLRMIRQRRIIVNSITYTGVHHAGRSKNRSTCQRHRYRSVIVKTGSAKLLVKKISLFPVFGSLKRRRRSGVWKPLCE
jgi:hypothetical protein